MLKKLEHLKKMMMTNRMLLRNMRRAVKPPSLFCKIMNLKVRMEITKTMMSPQLLLKLKEIAKERCIMSVIFGLKKEVNFVKSTKKWRQPLEKVEKKEMKIKIKMIMTMKSEKRMPLSRPMIMLMMKNMVMRSKKKTKTQPKSGMAG